MLPDWVKTEIYNKVIEIQELMISRKQDGIIVISKEQAYFQHNNENFEVMLRREMTNKSRVICENLEKYKEDLFRFEDDPPGPRTLLKQLRSCVTKISKCNNSVNIAHRNMNFISKCSSH